MNRLLPFFLFLCFLPFQQACAQVPEARPEVESQQFDKRLSQLLSFSVPVMGVDELEKQKGEVILFDTRELEEYEVSHIPGADYLGYGDFSKEKLASLSKDTTIVVYCSVGYRSEKIGEKLQKMGFTKVYNLYGSLFEWANQDHPLEDVKGRKTNLVHTYDKNWSQWVEEGKLVKVW